jgi:hypothetical protein
MSTFNNITLEQLDALVKKQTAFASFSELIHAPGNYRPTLYVFRKANAIIAHHYDLAQAARGDSRRAYRVNA